MVQVDWKFPSCHRCDYLLFQAVCWVPAIGHTLGMAQWTYRFLPSWNLMLVDRAIFLSHPLTSVGEVILRVLPRLLSPSVYLNGHLYLHTGNILLSDLTFPPGSTEESLSTFSFYIIRCQLSCFRSSLKGCHRCPENCNQPESLIVKTSTLGIWFASYLIYKM